MPFTATSSSSPCFSSSLPPKQPRPIGNGRSSSETRNSIALYGHNSRNHNNNNHPCTHNLMNINSVHNNNNVGDKKGCGRGKDTVGAPVGVNSIIQCARNNYCRRRSSSKGRCSSEQSSYRSYNDNFDLLPDATHNLSTISNYAIGTDTGSENYNESLNHHQRPPGEPALLHHSHLEDPHLKYFTDPVEKINAFPRPASLALTLPVNESQTVEFVDENRKRHSSHGKSGKSCFSVPNDFKEDFLCKSPTGTVTRKRNVKPTFTSYLGLESPSSHVSAATASTWLWQKSLSEGNLSIASAVDAPERPERYLREESQSNSKQYQNQQHQEKSKKQLMSTGARMNLHRKHSYGPGDYYYKDKDKNHDDENEITRPKSVPKFFRSISLRNLLQIGGMNKSRPGPAQGKRVSPPTAPLVSFPSFRIKKSQQAQQQQSETFELQPKHNQQEKEQQRYSGSSLGSAGSSYASSGSSGSDNRSSIGTDDGYLVSPTAYANGYLKDLDEYHPATQGILVNNSSYDSFPSSSVCAPSLHSTDMHQSLFNKVGGTNGGSNNGASSNGPGGSTGTPSPHVTVHVDPHPHPISNATGTGSGTLQHPPQSHNLHQLHGGPHNVFPPSSHTQPLTTSHYQTQISLEDQGIDMTQSPGRESPSSTASSNTGSGSGSAIGSVGSGSNGCRHSTASFDSGRASSTIYQGVRYSGLSSESSSGSFRHSYHSSSSSLGSIPPEEICNFDVSAMIAQGIPDHEVLNAWLTGIHFECYYQNFIQAGYDMHTISRMTPEDLNAIGVTKPHHRKRLKSEISQLNISDGLPEYIPASIEEWLGLLKLEEYNIKLRGQGYHSVRQVTNITWEDLEDIGILKLGHQKKFMLAIKRVEDILAGKRIPTSTTPNAYLTPLQRPLSNSGSSIGMPYSHPNQNNISANSANSHQYHHHPSSFPRGLTPQQHQLQQNLWRQQQQQQQQHNSSASSIYASGMQMQLHTHQPQIHNIQQQQQPATQNPPVGVTQPQYHPEVISIHVKNGRRKSLDNPDEEPIYGTSSFLPSATTSGSSTWQRNQNKMLDDGETTPTNESSNSYYSTSTITTSNSTTATLPRLLKNKPISKIMGGADLGNNYLSGPSQGQPAQNPQVPQYGDGYKSLPRDIGRMSKAGMGAYHHQHMNYAGATGTLGKNSGYGAMGKNGPPPPPRRGSCSGEPMSGHFSTFQQQGNLGFSNSNGSWANLPPPPPTLSCDAQFANPSKSVEEFPPPPPPDDLVMMSPQSVQSSSSSSKSAASSTSTSSSTSPNNPAQPLKISAAVSHISQPNYHNTTNGTGYHPSNVNNVAGGNPSNGGVGVVRTSPSHVKSRDPSPVGSDFSDSDLPANNGLLSRGVRRNGSDASFKSNSSTESESIPFANDNAGTIKQQKPSSRTQSVANSATQPTSPENHGTGDVLNDIGNMLADLTDELDAILEQEMSSKR